MEGEPRQRGAQRDTTDCRSASKHAEKEARGPDWRNTARRGQGSWQVARTSGPACYEPSGSVIKKASSRYRDRHTRAPGLQVHPLSVCVNACPGRGWRDRSRYLVPRFQRIFQRHVIEMHRNFAENIRVHLTTKLYIIVHFQCFRASNVLSEDRPGFVENGRDRSRRSFQAQKSRLRQADSRSSETTQKIVAPVRFAAVARYRVQRLLAEGEPAPPLVPRHAVQLSAGARKRGPGPPVHEIAYANDNDRVQARWKDQLAAPRGERYVVAILRPRFDENNRWDRSVALGGSIGDRGSR